MNTFAMRSALVGILSVSLALASGAAWATTYRLTDLGALGGTFSVGGAMNDSGQVTGRSFTADTADGETHAFLWDGTRMQDLGTLGGAGSSGADINNSGQVAGSSTTADGDLHAFLWDGTTMLDLGTLADDDSGVSQAVAINASGQVTGIAFTADGSRAFLWDGATMVNLGALGGSDSQPSAINDAGQVTGFAGTGAFLWDGTTMLDLNALIDPADPLQPFASLFSGIDINDRGQILVNGLDTRTNHFRVYVLTPIIAVPEPGTLALLGLGLLGLGLTRRRGAN